MPLGYDKSECMEVNEINNTLYNLQLILLREDNSEAAF